MKRAMDRDALLCDIRDSFYCIIRFDLILSLSAEYWTDT